MNLRPEVVVELRSLFKEGATPSRLIRHIVERHDDDSDYFGLIQFYFMEAFAVPIVRGLQPLDDYRHADLRYAFLNDDLLHNMVEKRGEWDTGNGADSWLDSLVAHDGMAQLERARTVVPTELHQCWPSLTPKEREYIHLLIASSRGMSERAKILSRLAECLQQQVNEHQAAPAGSHAG
jgi:hypothetical protein